MELVATARNMVVALADVVPYKLIRKYYVMGDLAKSIIHATNPVN